jgi:DNA-binding NtrC family response regulator
VEHFLKIYSQGTGKPMKTVSPEAFDILMRYDWPGNVRELENALERAVILQEGRIIMPEDLPEKLRARSKDKSDSVVSVTNLTLDELEKEYLLKVLEETGWHKKRAASILGINASTLYRKLQRYGFDKAVAALRPSEELVGSAKSDL